MVSEVGGKGTVTKCVEKCLNVTRITCVNVSTLCTCRPVGREKSRCREEVIIDGSGGAGECVHRVRHLLPIDCRLLPAL